MTTILSVNNLSVQLEIENEYINILDNVNFDIKEGEIFGLVGESGCGKSITALSILKLLPIPNSRIINGEILFNNNDIFKLSKNELQKIRGKEISIIFQEPQSSLNPLLTLEKQLLEVFEIHNEKIIKKDLIDLLLTVGLKDTDHILNSYPHQLSGGMLQRISIAMAVLLKPKLLIADEPTTALDVTVQAQIMNYLKILSLKKNNEYSFTKLNDKSKNQNNKKNNTKLNNETKNENNENTISKSYKETKNEKQTAKDIIPNLAPLSILFITHNLALVAQYANRVAVMYAGRIIEQATVKDFLENPLHPYSQGLLNAFPDISGKKKYKAIKGTVPSPKFFKEGCRFYDRCEKALPKCLIKPELITINKNEHKVACHLY